MIKYRENEISISSTNYIDGTVIINMPDGSVVCIPEEGATESERYIIQQIKDDVETRPEPIIDESVINEARISELKVLLANSDYIAIKIAEGAATIEEYSGVIAQRQLWREEINKLEALI